jgi:hypothetical protein
MANESAKVMFEIYREAGYGRKYRAVYFTELDEHNKESEISRAMAGDHAYDGFLCERKLASGKKMVESIVDRLNNGEALDGETLSELLTPFEA